MSWNDHVWSPKTRFSTPAPPDAPEIRGYRCYFQPERLEWTVTLDAVHLVMDGPATRAPHRRGDQSWRVEGTYPDPLPSWVSVPHGMILAARTGLLTLARAVEDAQP